MVAEHELQRSYGRPDWTSRVDIEDVGNAGLRMAAAMDTSGTSSDCPSKLRSLPSAAERTYDAAGSGPNDPTTATHAMDGNATTGAAAAVYAAAVATTAANAATAAVVTTAATTTAAAATNPTSGPAAAATNTGYATSSRPLGCSSSRTEDDHTDQSDRRRSNGRGTLGGAELMEELRAHRS